MQLGFFERKNWPIRDLCRLRSLHCRDSGNAGGHSAQSPCQGESRRGATTKRGEGLFIVRWGRMVGDGRS
jgi:hypothetical protein